MRVKGADRDLNAVDRAFSFTDTTAASRGSSRRSSSVAPGATPPADVDLEAPDGWVVKPSVGAGSRGVRHLTGATAVADAIAALHANGSTACIQPYLSDIDVVGETGLVYVGGEFSHSFRKVATKRLPCRRTEMRLWSGVKRTPRL